MTTYLYELPPSQVCYSRSVPSFTFRVLFSIHVGSFGITPFLAGETCQIWVRRTHTKLKLSLLYFWVCTQGGVETIFLQSPKRLRFQSTNRTNCTCGFHRIQLPNLSPYWRESRLCCAKIYLKFARNLDLLSCLSLMRLRLIELRLPGCLMGH